MMSQQRDLETRVSDARRRRLLARGGASDYTDAETFAAVEQVLRRVIEERTGTGLLLADLLDEEEWHLDPDIRLSSHRRLLGPVMLFCKRTLLLPLTRWLYEYTAANFRRQERVNRLLFACVEELAIENTRLRQLVAR